MVTSRPVERAVDPPGRRTLGEVADRFDLDLIVLFGSRATGKAREDSDADIAVRRRTGLLDFRAKVDLSVELGRILDVSVVDVVDLRQADPLLLKQVFAHAVPMFDGGGAFFTERLRAFHRYQDYRPFLDLERQAVRRALGFDAD
jgi:uncharacterized protein